MAKRRKRTNKNVPAVGVLRSHADRLWSLAVRIDWNHRCAACGNPEVQAHHLLPRHYTATRYELRNGIALCATHHTLGPDSAHQNGPAFDRFLEKSHFGVYGWLQAQLDDCSYMHFDGTKNAWYYIDMIRKLQPYVEPHEFVGIVGVRFAAWLEDNE